MTVASLRANGSFQAMTALLDEHGVAWSVENGAKHPKLVFEVAGRRHVHPFSKSCVDKLAPTRAAADIRRILKSAQPASEPDMSSRSVHVLDTDVAVVEYRGQRVVSFAMVDRVHQRPDGTAGRAFQDNRLRFERDVDFFLLASSQNNEIRGLGFTIPNRGLTLLTQRGYLKLTKSLTDDRAWAVQGEMVDRYFAVEEMAKALTSDAPADERIERALGIAKSTIHKVTGIERTVADVAAGNELALDAITELARRVDSIALTKPVISFDPSTTVAAHQIVEMAGIPPRDRQRGTTQIVTSRMLEFCTTRGVAPQRTPIDVNPGRPWRFPRALANEWLTGAAKGIEIIRSQIERRKAEKARRGSKTGQSALQLVR